MQYYPQHKPVTLTEIILGFLLLLAGAGFALSVVPVTIFQKYLWIFATSGYSDKVKIGIFIGGVIAGMLGLVIMTGSNKNIR